MERTKPNKKLIISCILVFVFALLLRVHFISLKQGLHIDEVFSLNTSNQSMYGLTKFYTPYYNYTGKELKIMTLYNDRSLKDTINDLKKLHKDNNDPPHTNLYYSTLRIWFTGFTDTNSHSLIWRGCSLNLLFFCFSFLLMYKILRRFFNDNALVPFGLLVAFSNTGTISNTLFMRPYQIQETVFLLLTYVVIRFWEDIENNRFLTCKNFFISSGILALTLLTGYLAPFYIGILGIVLIAKSIQAKQYKNIGFLFGAVGCSILLAWLCYLSYFNGFLSDRAMEVGTDNINLNLILLKKILKCFIYYLYYPLCWILVGVIGLKLVISKVKINLPKLAFYIYICALIWAIITMIIVPYKIVRYIFPILPLLSLAFPLFLSVFNGKEKNFYIMIFAIIFALYGLFPQAVESYDTEYPPMKKITPLQGRIENLFIAQKYIYTFIKEPQVPVYMTVDYLASVAEIVPIMNDKQIYNISYKISLIPLHLDTFYLVLIKSQLINLEEIKKIYDIKYESDLIRGVKTIKFVHR